MIIRLSGKADLKAVLTRELLGELEMFEEAQPLILGAIRRTWLAFRIGWRPTQEAVR
jgi:hypothetical protein